MESIELTGIWWLPGEPENRVAGTLTFSPLDGSDLSLVGSFAGLKGFAKPVEEVSLINGVAGGKKVTLVECLQTGRQFQAPGILSETYSPRWILLGELLGAAEDVVFAGLNLSFTYLPDWVKRSGLEFSIEQEGDKFKRTRLKYEQPEEYKHCTDTGSVGIRFTLSQSGIVGRDQHWREGVYFAVVDSPGVLDDLVEKWVTSLRNLLTLATAHPNQLEWIRVFRDASNQRPTDALELLFQPPEWRVKPRGRGLLPDEMLFALDDNVDFDSLIESWLEVSHRLRIPCNLFFGARNTDRMYLDQKFFNFALAAESFHRHAFSNSVLTVKDHKARIKSVIDAAPEEHRGWLKESLSWSNEPRLKARIDELIQHVELSIDIFPKTFSKVVADTRNYTAHYSSKLEGKAATGERLYYVTEGLGYLLQACFLMELGFDPPRVASIMNGTRQFKWVKDHLQHL